MICGLDSVEARRWINATLVNLVDWNDPEGTVKPLIDGGTEGMSQDQRVPYLRFPGPGSPNHSKTYLVL